MGRVVIKFQGKVVNEVNLRLGDTKIGRKPTCDIVLDDAAVSAEHAVIKKVGAAFTIQDLGSTNGTYVENTRVQQHQLKSGEEIYIGGYSLIFRDTMRPQPPMPAKPAAKSSAAQQQKTQLLAPWV
jgi:pSer/pThr/pTyr-binding forkhead associated (FHA) protein